MMTSTCGCYYKPPPGAYSAIKYLPQVDLKAHTTIVSTSSKTVLSQTFVNPSSTNDIKECSYVFPLYDGVSVVDFTCQVGSRIIKGIVKEKLKAREDYDAAVQRGETAGLLEQGSTSDVFVTSLGNIPAGVKLFVNITFIGELKHDFGAAGIRFTIPTRISPRYGQPGNHEDDETVFKGGIAITVDVKMPLDSPLQEVRSPSHPIAVTLGKTSASESQAPHLSRASATLSLGTSALEKDFVLEIIHLDNGKSKALLETHPTIPGQRALMATFVPNAPVQQSKPEIIFVADQSGSMQGARTKTLVAALRVFLKSLPVGIKFNICYFGNSHSFLFPKSQIYDQESLEKALKSIDGLDGDYGGTETLSAVKASIDSRDNQQPLSVILATDGDIWQQQELFDYLNVSVAASKKSLRVFTLGIGNSVSSALIEGVARAGNGFSQSVGEGEKLDGKVIRMLRGALIPDYGSLTMELQYQKCEDDNDGFVMIERVSESLVLDLDDDDWQDAKLDEAPNISAKTGVTGSKSVKTPVADGQARYNHLPTVPVPKLIQTPQDVPPMYPHNHVIVYVLISPEAAQGTIKSVVLKGSSAEEPFELEVPIQVLPEQGETIHKLAAKKAITELEEGRGWLVYAKDEKEVLIKEKHSAHFQSLVEREAVRLGIQYQIAGKFTSFVATETDPENPGNTVLREAGAIEKVNQHSQRSPTGSLFCAPSSSSNFDMQTGGGGALFGGSPTYTLFSDSITVSGGPQSFSSTEYSGSGSNFGAFGPAPGGLFDSASTPAQASLFGSVSSTPVRGGLFASKTSTQQPADTRMGFEATGSSRKMASTTTASGFQIDTNIKETDPLQKIIALQTFEGYWNLDAQLLEVVGLPAQHEAPQGVDGNVWAAMLAITFLEEKMAGDEDAWVMVVEKARGWLKDNEEVDKKVVAEKWALAKQLIMGTK